MYYYFCIIVIITVITIILYELFIEVLNICIIFLSIYIYIIIYLYIYTFIYLYFGGVVQESFFFLSYTNLMSTCKCTSSHKAVLVMSGRTCCIKIMHTYYALPDLLRFKHSLRFFSPCSSFLTFKNLLKYTFLHNI